MENFILSISHRWSGSSGGMIRHQAAADKIIRQTFVIWHTVSDFASKCACEKSVYWTHFVHSFPCIHSNHFLFFLLCVLSPLPLRPVIFPSKHLIKFHLTWHTIVFVHFIITKFGTEALVHWLLALAAVDFFYCHCHQLVRQLSTRLNSFDIRNAVANMYIVYHWIEIICSFFRACAQIYRILCFRIHCD